MAKIRFGEIVSDARKSTGGITYSRNRFGAYSRSRVSPVQPRTGAQLAVRNNLSNLSTGWRELTEAERLDWSDLGSQITKTDSLGQTYTLTGLQAYNAVNLLRVNLGESPVTDAPALDVVPSILTSTVTIDTGGPTYEVAYTAADGTADNGFAIFATSPVSQGRNFFSRSEYRFIDFFVGNAASPIDFEAAYNAKFGIPDEGEKVSILLIPFSENRIQGTPFRVDTITVA